MSDSTSTDSILSGPGLILQGAYAQGWHSMQNTSWIFEMGSFSTLTTYIDRGPMPYASLLAPSGWALTDSKFRPTTISLERIRFVDFVPWRRQNLRPISFSNAPYTIRLEGDSIVCLESADLSQTSSGTQTSVALRSIFVKPYIFMTTLCSYLPPWDRPRYNLSQLSSRPCLMLGVQSDHIVYLIPTTPDQ